MTPEKFGYRPSLWVKINRLVAFCIIRILGLNRATNRLGVELQQNLRSFYWIKAHGKKLALCVTNGRLLWRARTFFTEEPQILMWIDNDMDTESIFLDIGANVGLYTLYALARGAKKAYCAELDYLNCATLYKNLVVNGFSQKSLILPFPFTDKTGLCTVYYRDMIEGDALQSIDRHSPCDTLVSDLQHISSHITERIDDAIVRYGLQKPTHIKIDVDGNELPLLRGMHQTLRGALSLYMEITNELTEELDEVLRMVRDAGFIEKQRFTIWSKLQANEINGYNIIFSKDVGSQS